MMMILMMMMIRKIIQKHLVMFQIQMILKEFKKSARCCAPIQRGAPPCFDFNNIQTGSATSCIQAEDEEDDEEEDEGEEEGEEEKEEEDELLATFNKSIRQKATFASPYASPQKLGLMRGVSSQQEDA